MAESAEPKKRFKRKLTPFLCQEMLYDYATDQLDGERRQAVDEFLEKDRECQGILEGIRRGLEYSDKLSETGLKPEVLAQLRESENALSLGRRYSKWASWPETIRWSLTALSFSIVIAALVAVVPWEKVRMSGGQKSDTIEVAQIPDNSAEKLKDLQEANEVDASSTEGSGDEEGPADTKLAAHDGEESDVHSHSGDHEDPPKVAAQAPPPQQEKAKPTPIVTVPAVAVRPPLPEIPNSKATPIIIMANQEAQPTPSAPKDPKAKGFVYRAFMTLGDLEVVGPKITQLIREQGGEKAGEVELGWKRGEGRYYHFTMPTDNEERLLEQLRAYGPVRISKDPHPRVMPQGQVRFILWIESAK